MILKPVAAIKQVLRLRCWSMLMACALLIAAPVYADSESATPSANMDTAVQEQAITPTALPSQNIPALTEKKAGQGATRINSGTHLASVAVGLVFIVALILVLGWFLRRFNQGGLFNNSSIKIIASLPLGTRERLAVIDVGGQQLLLGITATQINTLHVFNEPIIAPGDNSPATSEFGKKLMTLLQQKNNQASAEPKDKTAV